MVPSFGRVPGSVPGDAPGHEEKSLAESTRAAEAIASCQGLWTSREVVGSEHQDEFLCPICTKFFGSRAACAIHVGRVHGNSTAGQLKMFVTGTCCPARKVNFRSRMRVFHHLLRVRLPCRVVIDTGGVPVVDSGVVAAADSRDLAARRECRRQGLHELVGLPCVRSMSV